MSVHRAYGLSQLTTFDLHLQTSRGRFGGAISVTTFGDSRYRESSASVAFGARVLGPVSIGGGADYMMTAVSGYDRTAALGSVVSLGWRTERTNGYATYRRPNLSTSGPLVIDKPASVVAGGGADLSEILSLYGTVERDDRGRTRTGIGAELRLHEQIAVRFGRTTGPTGWTGGFRVRSGRYLMEYGMRLHPELDATHAVTMSVVW